MWTKYFTVSLSIVDHVEKFRVTKIRFSPYGTAKMSIIMASVYEEYWRPTDDQPTSLSPTLENFKWPYRCNGLSDPPIFVLGRVLGRNNARGVYIRLAQSKTFLVVTKVHGRRFKGSLRMKASKWDSLLLKAGISSIKLTLYNCFWLGRSMLIFSCLFMPPLHQPLSSHTVQSSAVPAVGFPLCYPYPYL